MQGHPALPRREGVALEPPGRPNVATTKTAWRGEPPPPPSRAARDTGTGAATWCFFVCRARRFAGASTVARSKSSSCSGAVPRRGRASASRTIAAVEWNWTELPRRNELAPERPGREGPPRHFLAGRIVERMRAPARLEPLPRLAVGCPELPADRRRPGPAAIASRDLGMIPTPYRTTRGRSGGRRRCASAVSGFIRRSCHSTRVGIFRSLSGSSRSSSIRVGTRWPPAL